MRLEDLDDTAYSAWKNRARLHSEQRFKVRAEAMRNEAFRRGFKAAVVELVKAGAPTAAARAGLLHDIGAKLDTGEVLDEGKELDQDDADRYAECLIGDPDPLHAVLSFNRQVAAYIDLATAREGVDWRAGFEAAMDRVCLWIATGEEAGMKGGLSQAGIFVSVLLWKRPWFWPRDDAPTH